MDEARLARIERRVDERLERFEGRVTARMDRLERRIRRLELERDYLLKELSWADGKGYGSNAMSHLHTSTVMEMQHLRDERLKK